MTVICPSCDARFRDPPADILKTRALQCSKCEHEWVPGDSSNERMKLDAPSTAPEMQDLVGPANEIKTNLPVVMPNIHAAVKNEPLLVDRAPQEITRKKSFKGWHAASLACMALIAGSIAFKDTVMATLPGATPIYQAAGLATSAPSLQIENVTTVNTNKDGIRQLIVRGEIQNVADNTVPVPPIKLIMRGEENANLYAWTVSASKDSLKSGEKGRFTAVAHDFPENAIDVEVEFAPAKGKTDPAN